MKSAGTTELDVQAAVWTIPGARSKNGHAHSVPLTPLALNLLNWVLAHQLGLGHWTAHDLRRTALKAELGIAPIVLGHIANHRTTTKAGITLGIYVHHTYEREKREALELWADRLEGIISGGANIVAIRG